MSGGSRREWQTRVREFLEFDSALFKHASGLAGRAAGLGLFHLGWSRRGFNLLAALHGHDYPSWVCSVPERLAREAARPDRPHPLRQVYADHVERQTPTPQLDKFIRDPHRMLRAIAIVLKSPGVNEKGAIVINYSHFFPLFARLYDVERIGEKYHLVLEPSWSGYCNLDVLCYTQYRFPVFVQAYEPRDAAFIEKLGSNLVPVPTSTNWWVDHEMFRPQPGVDKDIDIVMIASWAKFKRHHRFFAALRKLRKLGLAPRVVLLGYPVDLTRDDILDLARDYGVADLLDVREWVPPAEVAQTLARSKVNVIWSRREGVNRAIIEGMFAGVPCILREGFNYGYRYPYINDQTGCFSSERDLPNRMRWMIEHYREYSPRDWVLENMSCLKATEILGGVLRQHALQRGEAWTSDLVPKVDRLHDMAYLNETDGARFEGDYEFLRGAIRTSVPAV